MSLAADTGLATGFRMHQTLGDSTAQPQSIAIALARARSKSDLSTKLNSVGKVP